MTRKIRTLVDFSEPTDASIWREELSLLVNEYGKYNFVGSGSPEGVVTAPIGSIYHRTDGGAGTSLYAKESGTGNTGWIGK